MAEGRPIAVARPIEVARPSEGVRSWDEVWATVFEPMRANSRADIDAFTDSLMSVRDEENHFDVFYPFKQNDNDHVFKHTHFGAIVRYVLPRNDYIIFVFIANYLAKLRPTLLPHAYKHYLDFSHFFDGESLMHFCHKHKFRRTMIHLFTQGANENIPNAGGFSPLDCAVRLPNNLNMVQVLSLLGAKLVKETTQSSQYYLPPYSILGALGYLNTPFR